MISRSQSRRRSRGSSRSGHRPNTPSKGNAAQLLDKYKGLARDAQMSGDRVQQEYYLQFADHYFRVLEEYNSKKEEQQQQQQQQRSPKSKQQNDDQQASNDQQQDKPKRSPRRKPDQEQGEGGQPQQDKPKRAPRKPKKEESDAGDSIADALPPAIGSDEEDEAA